MVVFFKFFLFVCLFKYLIYLIYYSFSCWFIAELMLTQYSYLYYNKAY